MLVHKMVHCRVMKGTGPEWTDKVVGIVLDDIEPGTCEAEIKYMVMQEVRSHMQATQIEHYTIGEIFNA